MARPRAAGSVPQARLPVPGSHCAGGQEAKRGFSHQALLSPGSASLWPTISGPTLPRVLYTAPAWPDRGARSYGAAPRGWDSAVGSEQVLGIGSSTASRRPGCLGFRPRGPGAGGTRWCRQAPGRSEPPFPPGSERLSSLRTRPARAGAPPPPELESPAALQSSTAAAVEPSSLGRDRLLASTATRLPAVRPCLSVSMAPG